jgi:uncharacterized tellurite resistance protein B-like protein
MIQIKNEQEAFLAIIYACMSVDGHISNQEINEMVYILSKKKLYAGVDVMGIYMRIQALSQSLSHDSFKIIELAAPHITPDLRQTVYANAMDIFFSDSSYHSNERQLATHLQQMLTIPIDDAQKIYDVIRIKNIG